MARGHDKAKLGRATLTGYHNAGRRVIGTENDFEAKGIALTGLPWHRKVKEGGNGIGCTKRRRGIAATLYSRLTLHSSANRGATIKIPRPSFDIAHD